MTVVGVVRDITYTRLNEEAQLRFPPEIGYGYHRTGQMAQFNGQWLTFEIILMAFE